jgi:dihydropteroate synthase
MTLVVGVLNVTPDSFSDGGSYVTDVAAIRHGLAMRDQGADIVDVGGESTRPGAAPTPPQVEAGRVLGVIESLAGKGVTVSVDTIHASTAASALDRGASIINDVSGGLADPDMAGVVATSSARYVVGHWRGNPLTMNQLADYANPAQDVALALAARTQALIAEGVAPEQIILDPGLGFAKLDDHNWAILSGLPTLARLGFPILLGASRKRFLSTVLPTGAHVADRDLPTAMITLLAGQSQMWGVRVHDVIANTTALRTLRAWSTGVAPSPLRANDHRSRAS